MRTGCPFPTRETLLSVVGLSLSRRYEQLGKRGRGLSGRQHVRALPGLRSRRCAQRGRISSSRSIPAPREAVDGARAARRCRARHRDRQIAARRARTCSARHGLLDHFITIKTADDAPSKPDPGMVLACDARGRCRGARHRRGRRHGLRHRDGARRRRRRHRRDMGLSSGRGARPGRAHSR